MIKRRRSLWHGSSEPTAQLGGQAKSHCSGGDIVVWANLDSKIYHFSGHRDYGHTKEGAYMCEKDALADERIREDDTHHLAHLVPA